MESNVIILESTKSTTFLCIVPVKLYPVKFNLPILEFPSLIHLTSINIVCLGSNGGKLSIFGLSGNHLVQALLSFDTLYCAIKYLNSLSPNVIKVKESNDLTPFKSIKDNVYSSPLLEKMGELILLKLS